jgi:hypothetical protein
MERAEEIYLKLLQLAYSFNKLGGRFINVQKSLTDIKEKDKNVLILPIKKNIYPQMPIFEIIDVKYNNIVII